MNFDSYQLPGALGQVKKTKNGIIAELGDEQLRIDFVFKDVARIKISRGGSFDEKPTFALVEELNLLGRIAFKVTESNGVTKVASSALTIQLTHQPFSIDAYREDGSTVFETLRDETGAWSYATDG